MSGDGSNGVFKPVYDEPKTIQLNGPARASGACTAGTTAVETCSTGAADATNCYAGAAAVVSCVAGPTASGYCQDGANAASCYSGAGAPPASPDNSAPA